MRIGGWVGQRWERAKEEARQAVQTPGRSLLNPMEQLDNFGNSINTPINRVQNGQPFWDDVDESRYKFSEKTGGPDDAVKPPEAPTPDNSAPELDRAREEERKRRGRASTILTGGRGLLDEPPSARRTLLGR